MANSFWLIIFGQEGEMNNFWAGNEEQINQL